MRWLINHFYIFVFLFFLSCENERDRYVHLSIDDVNESMAQITKDSTSYISVFEHPFFLYLHSLHEEYGCKFTLYCYEQNADYNIVQFPIKYKHELCACSDWLKFAFHATEPGQSKEKISNFKCFADSYKRTNDAIVNFSSEASLASIIRLEYFFASAEEVDFLFFNGVNNLLSADDSRNSYSGQTQNLIKTDFRLENMSYPSVEYLRTISDDTLVVFTHECFLKIEENQNKFRQFLKAINSPTIKYICR